MPDLETGRTMRAGLRLLAFALLVLFVAGLMVVVVAPRVDLLISGYFYHAHGGFYLAEYRPFVLLHHFAIRGAWYGGYCFAIGKY